MIGGGASGTHLAALDLAEFLRRAVPIEALTPESGLSLRSSNGLSVTTMKAGIRLRIVVDEVQSDDRGDVFDRMLVLEDGLGPLDDVGGARDRCAAGQLDDDEQRALVVLGQESGRREFGKSDDAGRGDSDHHQSR